MRDQEHTSALTLLFDCPRFGPLTHRACLRRQTERQELAVTVREARVVHGREVAAKKATKLGPPVREYCASGACGTGREIRAAAGVLVEPCSACGAALFGGEACAMCANRAAEAKGKPVTKADQPRLRGPVSTVIWDRPQPDVPFVPPSEQRKAVDAIAPAPRSAEDELEDLDDDEPAALEGEKQATPEVVHAETAAAQREDRRSGPAEEPRPEVVHPRGRARDLTGEHIGELFVLGRGKLHHTPNGTAKQYWRCRCDCGAEVEVDGGCLVREGHGSTRRCVACGQRRAAEAGRAASTRLPNGQTQVEFAVAHGIPVATVHKRLVRGWPMEQLGLPMSVSRRPRASVPASPPPEPAADPPRAAHAEPPAPPPAKETAMPKRIPCPECKSTSRHANSCSKPPKDAPIAPKSKPARAAKRNPELVAVDPAPATAVAITSVHDGTPGAAGDVQLVHLKAYTLDALLDLDHALQAELRTRREQHAAAVDRLDQAIAKRAA